MSPSPDLSSHEGDPTVEANGPTVSNGNGTKHHHKPVDSLGEALAGVTIGGSTADNGVTGASQQFGSSSIATSAPFTLAPGGGSSSTASNNNAANGSDTSNSNTNGWGHHAATPASQNGTGGATSNPATNALVSPC